MGPGGRAFLVSLVAFVVFGIALAAWSDGDEAGVAQESVGAGGAANASTGTRAGADGNETAGNATAGTNATT